jgi:tetratricopeptide (TPR) repeat protein
MTGECFADALAQLEWADAVFRDLEEGQYKKTTHYEQAAVIYQDIVRENPGTDHAFRAQTKLTDLYIAQAKWSEAEIAVQKLIVDFSGNERAAEAIRDMAYRYHVARKYEKAIELYQQVIDNWPQSQYALWSQMGVAMSNDMLGKDAAGQTEINRLLANYSGDERMAEVVRDIAYLYHSFGKHEKAIPLYQYVVDNWPGDYYAMWSLMGMAMSNVILGNDGAVQANINKLVADYSNSEHSDDVAKAIRDIAYQYRGLKKYEKANQLYQLIINHWPENEYALWSRMGLAQSHISTGNNASAQAEIDSLTANFNNHPSLSAALYDIAKRYEIEEEHEKAKDIYQQIIQQHPDSFEAGKARLDIPKINDSLLTLSRTDTELQAAIDKLFTDFAGHPDLSDVVLAVAEPYYDEALRKEAEGLTSQARSYFQKALAVHETVKNRVPGYVPTADTLCWTGVCYRALGDYQKSIECSQKVVDDWPGHEYAWRALFLVACNYEELKESGAISKSEAETKAKAAYEQLLEEYPNCLAAGTAQKWLTERNSK